MIKLEHSLPFRRAFNEWKAAKAADEQVYATTTPDHTGGLIQLGIDHPQRYAEVLKQRGNVSAALKGSEEKLISLLLTTPGRYGLEGHLHYEDGPEDMAWFEYNVGFEYKGNKFISNHLAESVTVGKAEGHTAHVVIEEDFSHRILLPHGYPVTVRPDLMPMWEEPHLWIPVLGSQPLVLTRQTMSEIAKVFPV